MKKSFSGWTNILEPLIRIAHANLQSGEGKYIWKDLSFQLLPNEIHAIIGESGSGKTTLATSIFGILPKSWDLKFETWDVAGLSWQKMIDQRFQKNLVNTVFLVPQNPNLAFHPYRDLLSQIQDFYTYGLKAKFQKEEILSLWQDMGIEGGYNLLKRMPRNLSGGEKQRICLSLAILANPRILILDEPTTGLDASTELWVLRRIKEIASVSGRGVIFISHDLRIVESLASQVTIMKEGQIVESQPIKERKIELHSPYGQALENAHKIFV